jgi:hypothetical protein
MPIFSRLAREDATEARRLILHLQTQLALQQLSMETYNDVLTGVSTSIILTCPPF